MEQCVCLDLSTYFLTGFTALICTHPFSLLHPSSSVMWGWLKKHTVQHIRADIWRAYTQMSQKPTNTNWGFLALVKMRSCHFCTFTLSLEQGLSHYTSSIHMLSRLQTKLLSHFICAFPWMLIWGKILKVLNAKTPVNSFGNHLCSLTGFLLSDPQLRK